jgi:hypothetical protein
VKLVAVGILLLLTADSTGAQAPPSSPVDGVTRALDDAQLMFYNGRYREAAALTADSCAAGADSLGRCELRTSALLFQMRRALGDATDRQQAFSRCEECPALLSTFIADIRAGQSTARAALKATPDDDDTLFMLGKLDLNYVWLQLGTLGRKTGWGEYWEARRSLDRVLAANPAHVRAKVARAWIDYIVDTRMPRGSKWLLGGGNRKKGLQAVLDATAMPADRFVHAEAVFGLWDMQVREKTLADAVTTATALAADFPENAELQKFLEKHAAVPASR